MRATTFRAAIAAVNCMVAAATFAEEPDAFVEYVESTSAGKQYIDTGVIGKCGTKAEMKLLWAATGDTVFLGTLAASDGDTRFLLCAKSARSPANAISGGHRTYTKGSVTYSSTPALTTSYSMSRQRGRSTSIRRSSAGATPRWRRMLCGLG